MTAQSTLRVLRALRCFFCSLFIYGSVILSSANCKPSESLQNKYVTYNFKDEGFLSAQLLQTKGSSRYLGGRPTADSARLFCLENALKVARQRAVRVIVHTRFNLKAVKSSSTTGSRGFDQDYPAAITDLDIFRAEADFSGMLGRGFVALQDARDTETCSVIFRITGLDLPAEIRSTPVFFSPEIAGQAGR